MKQLHFIFLSLGCLISLNSCSQGDSPGVDDRESESYIYFSTNLSDVASTRGPQLTESEFTQFYVTSFFGTGSGGQRYFEKVEFNKQGASNKFTSSPGYIWPATNMDFYAWYPNASAYRFSVSQNAYSMIGFKVEDNITKHLDLVTAHTSTIFSNFENDETNGVTLNFEHRLCQIGVNALSSNTKYNVEVAGVRIGNVTKSGTFNFNGSINTETGGNTFWSGITSGKVEYIFGTSDNILTVGSSSSPIMGKGGNAMVIPTGKISAWTPATDAANSNGGMFISILIRVSAKADGIQLYPALGLSADDQVEKTIFAVNKTSKAIKGIKKEDGKFYDSNNNVYTLTANDEQKEFAWAAVPVEVTWIPGKYYTYTLNYSNGVGIRDPKEPKHPGHPILGGDVTATVTLSDWGTPKDTYIDVPGTGSGQGSADNNK